MKPRRTVVRQASVRSPRDAWRRPRPMLDCLAILEANGFTEAKGVIGVTLVRVCGLLALRVHFADSRGTLATGLRGGSGKPVRWRPPIVSTGSEPWMVTRDALELLATLDVDTPVRWG